MKLALLLISPFLVKFALPIKIQAESKRLSVHCFCVTVKSPETSNHYIQHKGDSVIVNKIIDSIFSFPEVKRQQTFLDSLTHHKGRVSMIVMQRPGKRNKYYWIAVGYNGPLRFETYFNFYFLPSNMVIKYLDNRTGNLITLDQWRKMNHKD